VNEYIVAPARRLDKTVSLPEESPVDHQQLTIAAVAALIGFLSIIDVIVDLL
jgi:hypothetical protein